MLEPNEVRVTANRRMKDAPVSARSAAFRGCSGLMAITAVLFWTTLLILGWKIAGFGVALVFLVLAFAMRVISKRLESSARVHQLAAQQERDAKAQKIAERLANRQLLDRPLVVFLRPHAEEARFSWCIGNLGTWHAGMPENSGPYAAAAARRDVEGVIANIAEPLGDLVIIGGEKTIGGARIESSLNGWVRIVESLCKAACAIFVLPSNSEGVTTEIILLRQHLLLRKVVFIMPPKVVEDFPDAFLVRYATRKSPEFRRSAADRLHFLNLGVEAYWSTVREHFSTIGIAFPQFRERGLTFSLSNDGKQVYEICELTSYLPGWSEREEWIATRQRSALSRMHDDVLKKWGCSLLEDSRTLQIWPLLSHLVNFVNLEAKTPRD